MTLPGGIDVGRDEGHESGKAVAVRDLRPALVQRRQLDCRIEVVAVGVQLVEQIHEVVGG